jgi:N-acylglucosamine-6-phosphate 2-epimerase
VVSCQAEGESPFNNPDDVAKFAVTAHMGGASAIRTEGLEKVKAVLKKVQLPVIGLIKSEFEDGYVRITGSEQDAVHLLEAGCHIVATDGTFREREGKTGPDFIRYLKQKYPAMVIMADIATLDEAKACVNAGADCISTTLSGYTPDTVEKDATAPDLDLLAQLVMINASSVPVFAEGRFNTPELASRAIRAGAWSVVTGTAITRPQVVTKWFFDAIME